MDIRPSTSQERRLLFIETLLNSTDKISKVSKHSVNSGVAGGVAKVAGKAEKDIFLALSELFPDLAFDTGLDQSAKNLGFTIRLSAMASTTYVRVVGSPGTTYAPGTHTMPSTEGVTFNVQRQVVIGAAGFAYVPVVAAATGSRTNVAPLTISQVSPQPAGHLYCINEYAAINGADAETDEMFRARIKDGGNVLAKNTLGMIQALAIATNPKVLKAYNYGINKLGKRVIAISTQNGEDLNDSELDQLKVVVGSFLTLSDSQWWGTNYIGVQFVNIRYQPIDISFRILLDNSVNPDTVRKEIQAAIAKYLDFRIFDPVKMKVEWDNLLEIVKRTSGVKYVPDQFFYPRVDVAVNTYKLPRLRGFMMLDMDGNIISNLSGTLSPVYYPNDVDFAYQATVLQTL
jgi:hypothetical protein